MVANIRLIAGVTAVAVTATVGALGAAASAEPGLSWTAVSAVPVQRGIAAPNVLARQLRQSAVAQGSHQLENPRGLAAYYGYLADGTLVPDPTRTQSPDHSVEASKTEPDKNTYLRLRDLHGADAGYDYGTHFLFQGHEGGPAGYLTRINLDADAAHRVTLLATTMVDGTPVPTVDGSTWDPWARRLLFTVEKGADGGVLQSTPDVDATVQDLSFALGRAGYEGIQNDSAGNLWLVEDVGGASPSGSKARNPNSFVYRFLPTDRADLTRGGRLQALRVFSARTRTPITYRPIDPTHPTGGIFTDDQRDLSSHGIRFATSWVTIHDTAIDRSGVAFDANAAAKAAGATPLKRPENGVFRPGTGFREFYFETTGDTNATSDANAGYGGWGAVYRLTQRDPGADTGHLEVVYLGDREHTGLDNVTFIDRDHVAFVEDCGDTLHAQRGAFDSGYLFDLRADYRHGAQPVRFLAEGRDEAATLDNLLVAAGNGFANDGDNEITGIHLSNGDPGVNGILGAQLPRPLRNGWRLFWTQQHGQNITWEITSTTG
jgi:hypothetical protein